MKNTFSICPSLISLPDISKWNTSKVKYMSFMFFECSSLLSLPDISKWDTNNVKYMDSMFKECSSLCSLPDISKWNTENVKDMSNMFCQCSSLISLPDLSKWNTDKIYDISLMFSNCISLSYLPDIKWIFSSRLYKGDIFENCFSLIFTSNTSNLNNDIKLITQNIEQENKKAADFLKYDQEHYYSSNEESFEEIYNEESSETSNDETNFKFLNLDKTFINDIIDKMKFFPNNLDDNNFGNDKNKNK